MPGRMTPSIPVVVPVTPAHHSPSHHSATHHSAAIMVAVLIAIFLFATLGALLQLLSQALSDRLVLLLHHRTAWSRLGSGTLLGAGTLGTRSLGTRSNATGEDNRRCREYEHMVSHLNLLDEGHTQVGDALILRSYCARTRAVIGSPHQRLSADRPLCERRGRNVRFAPQADIKGSKFQRSKN